MPQDLLFHVIVPGHEYRLFADGRVEGFGENVKVINRFHRVCSDLLQAERGQADWAAKSQDEDMELPQTSPAA